MHPNAKRALADAADEPFFLDGEHLARLDMDSLGHAHASVRELEPRIIGAALHPGHFQPLVVVDVAKNSASAEKGLKPGDMIMEAAQEEVKTASQIAGKVADAKKSGRKSILLLVERQGDLRFVAIRIDQS